MCWYTRYKKYAKISIASEDMTVLKIGVKDNNLPLFFKSPCFGYSYCPDTLNKLSENDGSLELCKGDDWKSAKCYYGFHSYNIDNKIYWKTHNYGMENIFYISSKKAFDRLCFQPNKNIIGIFIIPKGAEYCENEFGEIVSNQIIFKKYSQNLFSLLNTLSGRKIREYIN